MFTCYLVTLIMTYGLIPLVHKLDFLHVVRQCRIVSHQRHIHPTVLR